MLPYYYERLKIMKQNETKLCQGILQLPYDIRSLNVLRVFISESLNILNITQKEMQPFQLAAEEICSYILFNHISPDDEELIMVKYHLLQDSILEFEFHYMGTPIRKDEVATYKDADASDDNLDKLWYHLVEGLTDNVKLINLGNDGWRIIFSKKIAGAHYIRRAPQELHGDDTEKKDLSDVIYRLSTPADAAALVDLTHKTYAYTFAEPEFYYEEHLAEALKNGSIASIVSELNGEIIGHVGLAYHSDYPDCAEIGMLMVSPEYRQTRLTFILSKKFKELILNKEEYRKNIFTTVSTTDHTASQHMIQKLASLYPAMLMISACPRADYEKDSEIIHSKRETLVFGIKLTYESEATIYLPTTHQPVMTALFEQLNANLTLSDQEEMTYADETKISIEPFELSYSANIILHSCATDWSEVVRKTIYKLRCDGIKTINIMVPAWVPLPKDMRESMKKLNAFFAGTPIFEKDKWYIAYICLDSEIVDFEEIKIYNPASQNLLAHIQDEYEYVFGKITARTDK